jgi:hypothetical protein
MTSSWEEKPRSWEEKPRGEALLAVNDISGALSKRKGPRTGAGLPLFYTFSIARTKGEKRQFPEVYISRAVIGLRGIAPFSGLDKIFVFAPEVVQIRNLASNGR